MRRLDLQLLAMIAHARGQLAQRGLVVDDRILLNGFSASGTFANRFTMLHPDRVRACAVGGTNGVLMLPDESIDGRALGYPVGVADLLELTGAPFARSTWRRVPQLAYLGDRDDNDAVAMDDAYADDERALIHDLLGARMQPDRWQRTQARYRDAGANVLFVTYPGIGHGTNGAINRDVVEFFRRAIAPAANDR